MGDTRHLRERKVVVRTTDPKVEEPNFGSANGWGRMQLQRLGVQFAPNAKKRLDLNKVLNVREADWPVEIQQSTPPLAYLFNYQGSQRVPGNWKRSTWNQKLAVLMTTK